MKLLKSLTLAAAMAACVAQAHAVTVNGNLDGADATMNGRFFRDATASTCGAPKAFPGNFNPGTQYTYETTTLYNNGPAKCVTVTLDTGTCDGNVFLSAHQGTFNPASLGDNYLGDVGSSVSRSFSFEAPANAQIVLMASTTISSPGNCNYSISSSELTDSSGGSYNPGTDKEVVGLISDQINSAKRFAQSQSSNVLGRLEKVHKRRLQQPEEEVVASSWKGIPKPAEPTTPQNAPAQAANVNAANDVDSAGATSKTASRAGFASLVGADSGSVSAPVLSASNSSGAPKLPWSSLGLNGESREFLGSGLVGWSAGSIDLGEIGVLDSTSTYSVISFGADKQVAEDLTVGFGFGGGYGRSHIGDNGTRNTSYNYSLYAYGSYQPMDMDGFFLDGVVGYGRLNFDGRRYSSVENIYASSDRTGSQWFSSLSAGYDFVESDVLISPYLRLNIISTRLNEADEKGTLTNNLKYSDQTVSTRQFGAGVRVERSFKTNDYLLKPSVRLEYIHDFNSPGNAKVSYVGVASSPVYDVKLNSIGRNMTSLGLGLDIFARKSWSIGLRYQYSHGSYSEKVQSFGASFTQSF